MGCPRVSVFLGLSLDGYIARADGGLDWMTIVDRDPPEDTGYQALWEAVDTIIIGRYTYDAVLTFPQWPYHPKRVVVLTSRPAVAQYGESFYQGSLATLVEQLGSEGVQHIYLDGGNAVRQGLVSGLIDEMTLSWVPILLGTGRPLFTRDCPEQAWGLVASRSFPSGLVQATYRPRPHPSQAPLEA